MTPYEEAQRLIRRRDRLGHPEFVVAYIEAEARAHHPDGNPKRLSPYMVDNFDVSLGDLRAGFAVLGEATQRATLEIARAMSLLKVGA